MMKASPIPASRVSGEETSGDSDAWAKWSVDLGFQAINMSWGAAKDYLRIDLGQKEGIDIEIRNAFHFRPRRPKRLLRAIYWTSWPTTKRII